VEPDCRSCSDSGVIRLAGPVPAGWSADTLRRALADGSACLCTCEQAQWWLSWLCAMRTEYGSPVPERGVPEGLVADEGWLDKWIRRRCGR
jgi:hypothetical protein